MAQEQNTNQPTNSDFKQVSFADVSLDYLKQHFKNTYKVSKGSASQVVLGLNEMGERVSSSIDNEYQQALYPKLKEFCTGLVSKYTETFLSTFSSDVDKQVYGANLNGNRNTGSLYKSIPSGVNRNLTYNYSQFKQLLRVLSSRLRFVVQRDPSSVQRYKDNQSEFTAYQKLQESCKSYLTYMDTVTNDWNTLVTELRTKFSVTPSTSRSEKQSRSNQSDQPRRFTQSGQSGQSGQRRQPTRQQSRQTTSNTSSSGQGQTRPQYKQVRTTSHRQSAHTTQNTDTEWQTVKTRPNSSRNTRANNA